MKKIKECRVCGSNRLKGYLDLRDLPLANSFYKKSKKYPLKVLLCQDCFLSQLSVVVPPKKLYLNYPYHSSVSETFKVHCHKMAMELKKFKFDDRDNGVGFGNNKGVSDFRSVLDIACNDGCLLEQFRLTGKYVVNGVEPSKSFKSNCHEKLIPFINQFWSSRLVDYYRIPHQHFIIAQNVLGHVDDIYDFLDGVEKCLKEDGVFVCEVPHIMRMIENNAFDTVYHEHLSYFLFKNLAQSFKKAGLTIFRVDEFDIHAGTIRVYADKGVRGIEQSVRRMYLKEAWLYGENPYYNFADRAYEIQQELISVLEYIYRDGKKVMAYGASAKGNTLLTSSGITTRHIHSIVDDTKEKQGNMNPCGIPIVAFSHFEKEKPDYILLTAWNFQKELIAKTAKFGVKYIIPIPVVKIV